MSKKEVQEQIAEKLMENGLLESLLSDRIAGNSTGSEVEVNSTDVHVILKNNEFSFNNAKVVFSGKHGGGSQEENVTDTENTLTVSGKGKFECTITKISELKISDLNIRKVSDDNIKIV